METDLGFNKLNDSQH